MTLKIIHRKNDMYDVYDKESGEWLFSRSHPDNVFDKLEKYGAVNIEFVDENFT